MPWQSFCPLTYLFCYLQTFQFHSTTFIFYISSFTNTSFLFSATTQADSCITLHGLSQLQHFQLCCMYFPFLPCCTINDPQVTDAVMHIFSGNDFHISYNPSVTSQQQVVNCSQYVTRYIDGQFIILLSKIYVCHNHFLLLYKKLAKENK